MITHRRFVPRHSGEERLDSACTVAIGYNVERFANGRNNVRTIELEGADNIRDLGGMPVAGNRRIAKGLLFRGSALAGITERDMQLLFGELGIKRVIDVRTGWERAAKPDIQAPGVEYLHIPFYDIEKVGIEYTEPAAGTKVIGRDVACDPDLFYRSLANPLTVRQMREGLHSMLDSAIAGRPVYVHCSGGKDRAGILTLLALTVLGADRNAILDDYLLTNVARHTPASCAWPMATKNAPASSRTPIARAPRTSSRFERPSTRAMETWKRSCATSSASTTVTACKHARPARSRSYKPPKHSSATSCMNSSDKYTGSFRAVLSVMCAPAPAAP